MSDELLDLLGNWIEHIGATIAAIGETKQLGVTDEVGLRLGFVGNAVQGVGNMLQAIANAEDTGVSLGNWLQVAGTTSNSVAEYHMLKNSTEDLDDQQLEIFGDAYQSIGAMVASIDRLGENPKLVYGNIAQSIGAALEGIGIHIAIVDDEKKGQLIETIGGWLQSFGTAYQAIGATRGYLSGLTHPI